MISRIANLMPADAMFTVTLLSRQANDQFTSVAYRARLKPKQGGLVDRTALVTNQEVDWQLYQESQTTAPKLFDRLVDELGNQYELQDLNSRLFAQVHDVTAVFQQTSSGLR